MESEHRLTLLGNVEHQDQILKAIRTGTSPPTAFARLGYSRDLFSKYLKTLQSGHLYGGSGGPASEEYLGNLRSFFDEISQAVAEGEQRMVEIINDAAGRVNEKTGLSDWQPAKFLLTHGNARYNWFPHQEPQVIDMTHHGSSAPEFREAKNLSEAELIEGLDDPEWAQALLPRTVKSE